MAEDAVFSAGDVEKFAYCPLVWWLSRGEADAEGEAVVRGAEEHEVLARGLSTVREDEAQAQESQAGVLYFAVAATIIALFGVAFLHRFEVEVGLIFGATALIWLLASVYYLYRAEILVTPAERLIAERLILGFAIVATLLAAYAVFTSLIVDPVLAAVLEVVALVWLIGACYWLYRTTRALERAGAVRAQLDVAEGAIAYVDASAQPPALLTAEGSGLRGRPDYVLVRDGAYVPVEVKTGRTPRGPLFSHILQVAAYCHLVEASYGKTPPYGILQYPEASHEIEYNADLRRLLLTKLQEMRAALAAGEAHRNHNRPGKCLHCSRRSVCPERLA